MFFTDKNCSIKVRTPETCLSALPYKNTTFINSSVACQNACYMQYNEVCTGIVYCNGCYLANFNCNFCKAYPPTPETWINASGVVSYSESRLCTGGIVTTVSFFFFF